ncbi:unnamed protein product [Zymoseptoria tritici ST99CH_3D1]|uniref:Uncharacterized protein n=1 Tax=Zymoseptoria tritici ST99CH_1E4 TaxID=1276532 RepID=A0A2H1GU92_ZYMTR|nr:unnamed protein product [Zymoseptoria tritici ST99CH_1E4]SMR59991.1 unnamed protein product [Zymoseptoria tritici ST99CH_3D1]
MPPDVEYMDLSANDDGPHGVSKHHQDQQAFVDDLLEAEDSSKLRREKAQSKDSSKTQTRQLAESMSGPSSSRVEYQTGRPKLRRVLDSGWNLKSVQSSVPRVASQRPLPAPASTSEPSVQTQRPHSLHGYHPHPYDKNKNNDGMIPFASVEETPPPKKVRRDLGNGNVSLYNTPPQSEADSTSMFVTPERTLAPRPPRSSLKHPRTDSQREVNTSSPHFNQDTPVQRHTPGSFGSQARKIAGGNGYASSPSASSIPVEVDEGTANLLAAMRSAQSTIEAMEAREGRLLAPMIELGQRVRALEADNRKLKALVGRYTAAASAAASPTPDRQRSREAMGTPPIMTPPTGIPVMRTPTPMRTPARRSGPIPGGEYGGPKYTGTPEKGVFDGMFKKHQEGGDMPRAPVGSSPQERAAREAEFEARKARGLARRAAREASGGAAATGEAGVGVGGL